MLSAGGRYGPSWSELLWMIFALVCIVIPEASGFNLEPESAQIFADPTRDELFWGRESYFGFSVALQRNHNDNAAWLVVGAPRANSSMYPATRITEPGAIFKCDLQHDKRPCQELKIDQEGNAVRPNSGYHDMKNGGWLGASLDSQPTREEGRQATAMCAPRWRNQFYSSQDLMNGACYWLNASLSDAPAYKKLPLSDLTKQVKSVSGRNLFYYAHGQAGISIHFPDDPKQMIIGAPGVFNWQGSVIRLSDADSTILPEVGGRQRRPSGSESDMFSSPLVPNPYYTSAIRDFDLNGYSITSGRFFAKSQLLYVSGAPRGASMYGKVLMFGFPVWEQQKMDIYAEWKGSQLGENFGASLVSADVNGDGLSDLVVGSPTFSDPNRPDMGKMQVFLSTGDYRITKTSSHSGSRTPLARFSTTLASPGDINNDLYEDIAVGAPWENEGKGAVYIYLGSEFGLRKDFAQRLSPEDMMMPTSPNLRGFGMSISRGIDIDGNGYPDLAIGSFVSGHALVLRSRAVASLRGYIIVDPPALSLDDTGFKLEVCVKYKGNRVPKNIDVPGSITLDHGHPSPRASFSDNDRAIQNFSIKATREKVECRTFSVKVEANKIDARRPIHVRFDYGIQEIPGQRLNQIKTDPEEPKSTLFPVRILTDCEDDGDNICDTDMHIEADFINYKGDQQLIIGGNSNPIMRVTVINIGESVFLPNITIKVPKPFALFMPTSHSCNFAIKGSRLELVCQLTNPMTKDVQDVIEVQIDASQVTDTSSELKVDVQVAGEGVEMKPDDNILTQKLQLAADAELELRGYSRGEQILYPRLDEDTINTTIASESFTHYYTVRKSGPTPLEKVEFTVDIPINFTGEVNFITLYEPQTNFLRQSFLCSAEGITLAVDKSENGKGGGEVPIIETDIETPPPIARGDEDTIFLPPWSTKDGVRSSTNSSLHEIQTFTCPSTQVSCAKLRCQIDSWPGGTSSAEFSIKMDIHYIPLAAHISAQVGAIVRSTATASIVSLNQDLIFHGNKKTTGSIDTALLPLSLPGRSVPWWYILLAVLAGLLLVILLVYILYRIGFFRRKEQEEMKAQRAHVEAQTNYGATNSE